MKRILFVDDEAPILDGLRNLLRKQRKQWEMTFALGGEKALEELARAPYDVVVTDMRMPGMDGAELLAQVKVRSPATARLVLSGHSDRDAILRSLPVAHQFLAKPCDPEQLKVTIDRTCNLQQLLQDPTLREMVARLDHLPSAPRTYFDLCEAIHRTDANPADLAAIIERDPGMAAKVLQIANSAYFGRSEPVVGIAQAVIVLGVEMLKGLALSSHVFGSAPKELAGLQFTRMQSLSVIEAQLARRFARHPSHAEQIFSAALVHDIGWIILGMGMPERYAGVLREAQSSGRPVEDVERELLGVTHAEVGAYLLGMWGVPFSLVETVAFHHEPSRVTGGSREILRALHLADAVIHAEALGIQTLAEALDEKFLLETGGMVDHQALRDAAREDIALWRRTHLAEAA